MDSPQTSTSSRDSTEFSEESSNQNSMIADIKKMKEKRLKLLDEFESDEEAELLALLREAQENQRKKRAALKAKRNSFSENKTPSRRSERIKSQVVNESKIPESVMYEPVVNEKPRERPVAKVKPQKKPVAKVKPQKKPVAKVKPQKKPVAKVKPQKKPVAKVKNLEKVENGYGHVPGVEVGERWNTRLECSHSRVHRPTIAGIHPGPQGAYSIALSGGYAEDLDDGHTVIFTGAGGRDLKGTLGKTRNVRSAPQIKDQELNGANMSLIKSLETGSPVRVIRGHKSGSCFAPEHGYRYDGLYKVFEYCYTYGFSGYRVFRFMMSRLEDQKPAPWECPKMMDFEPPFKKMKFELTSTPSAHLLNGEDLDREIDECIRKLCEESVYVYNEEEHCPFATFRGWDFE